MNSADTGFQMSRISNRIFGLFPFARLDNFLSLREYHFCTPLLMESNGIATFPKNSTL